MINKVHGIAQKLKYKGIQFIIQSAAFTIFFFYNQNHEDIKQSKCDESDESNSESLYGSEKDFQYHFLR